jgi:cystathionine beta-lyase/cystathionine gamma-synthase
MAKKVSNAAENKARLGTVAIHGGRTRPNPGEPVAEPLVQGVNYVQEFGTSEGLRYTRYGNTPNAEVVQRTLAKLEGAESALILASGMGATACGLLALLRPGDHIVSSSWIYGGTYRLLNEELRTMGIDVSFADPLEQRSWRRAVRRETRVIFVETPVNPTCRILDLEPLAKLAQEKGVALVVDSTLASPVNFRPLEYGADVVIHSATKYLNGHHDILGGAVAGTGAYVEEVRKKMLLWGPAPDPFACWLLERGLKTIVIRVKQSNENAQRLAEHCETHPGIAKVHYPGLASHPDHSRASRTLDGFGGMMAIELVGGGRAADRFLRRLQLFTHAASLGGVDSLVIEPRYSSHAAMTPEERARVGIPDGFIRISVGIEDVKDLIEDLDQALKK